MKQDEWNDHGILEGKIKNSLKVDAKVNETSWKMKQCNLSVDSSIFRSVLMFF